MTTPSRSASGYRIRFPLTAAAGLLATVVLVLSLVYDVNVIEVPLGFLARIERSSVDDIVTSLLLVAVALAADLFRGRRLERRSATLDLERLRVVEVTMRTVQDIVNNCLNQLQLVRVEAEGHVPDETIALFDQSIREASAQLNALASLKKYAEQAMVMGPGLRS